MHKFFLGLILTIYITAATMTTNLIYDDIIVDVTNSIYDDIIVDVYNSSCIETVNYQFVHLNNTEVNKSNIGNSILVSVIEQLGQKSLRADIVLLT
jgi:hypothetical protein